MTPEALQARTIFEDAGAQLKEAAKDLKDKNRIQADFAMRGKPCKHILAVRMLLERQLKGDPNPTADEIPARPPRKTYKQDWPNYNLAQMNEKDHFQVLLADLCRPLPELPLKNAEKGGRLAPADQ